MLDGYKPVTTQIFDRKSKYLDDDSVFAVKDSLVVDFTPLKGNKDATVELVYDIYLATNDEKRVGSTPLVTSGGSTEM